MKNKKEKEAPSTRKNRLSRGGFIQLIIIIIVALLILRFLGISLAGVLGQQSVHDFFVYLWHLTKEIWQDFLLFVNFIRGIILNEGSSIK